MQFKNPEILYFLFALVVPIMVHLFQLKRFKPQVFSNVAFLKNISLQTRKSSQLKKWLLLVCRLFLLATLILAFAQPYFPAIQQNLASNHLVIALDNSFSMQAKGKKGPLLPNAIQEILEQVPPTQTFTLLTSTNSFWDIDTQSSQTDIQNINYNAAPFNLKTIQNKINSKYAAKTYDLLVISDGNLSFDTINTSASQNYFYPVKAVNTQNIAIESVNINNENPNFNELVITLQGHNISDSTLCNLSVLDNEKMYSKSKISVKNGEKKITINLPKQPINGRITIDSADLDYDNVFYFSISAQNETLVGIIGKKINEIEKVFQKQNIKITYITPNQDLNNFNTIVVNEETNNLNALGEKLKKVYHQGTSIIFIPNTQIPITDNNTFLSHFGAIKFNSLKTNQNSITTIHSEHELYKNVFNKTPQNFQYPITYKNLVLSGTVTPILSYANQEIYLGNINNGLANLYIFSSSFQSNETNLLQSSIIVPTLYNMVLNAQVNELKNYTIASGNTLIVNANTSNSEPLHIHSKNQSGIAQQQPLGLNTKIILDNFPTEPGNYTITQNNKIINQISLNYARTESNLTLTQTDIFNNFAKVSSIDQVLTHINESRLGIQLWKYFLLTTLLFLIFELLIQKFVK